MDFLESAVLLVPALTGLAVTVYHGEPDVLSQFEDQYCFSPQLQRIYTASGIKAFCKICSEKLIYELAEPLGSYLIAAKTDRGLVLLGPYVVDEWDEQTSHSLLVKLGIPEKVIRPYKSYRCKLPISQQDHTLKAALLIIGQLDGGKIQRQIKTIHIDAVSNDKDLTFVDSYEDTSITNRRYSLEQAFIKAISEGDIEKVYEVMAEMRENISNIRFISDNLTDQIAGAAGLRSDVRMGAILGGLSPMLVDFISQEYAQKIQHTTSKKEVNSLMMRLIEQICAVVRKTHEENYSMGVRKAMDYMEINLSKSMDSEEIAKAVGMDRRLLVKTFSRETGMTFKQYLAKSRCKVAAGLLRSSQFSIQAIAAYVGYTDNNYFAKVFKANFGTSPGEYRRVHWPSE